MAAGLGAVRALIAGLEAELSAGLEAEAGSLAGLEALSGAVIGVGVCAKVMAVAAKKTVSVFSNVMRMFMRQILARQSAGRQA